MKAVEHICAHMWLDIRSHHCAEAPHSKMGCSHFREKDILSAHERLEQNQLIRCILWGLNDDLRVMIFNGCLHIAKENPSALQNQAKR